MENAKRKIISFWLTHVFLRQIAKRYPEYFEKWINDLTDNRNCRKVMLLRYTGEPLKFEAIAFEMNTDVRNVFSYHKKVIDLIISNS
jgi:hypothetical protein